ncbi:MAG: EamA family transporter [Alphaproteobacteria bacterium]
MAKNRTVFLLLVAVLMQAAGNAFMSIGMKELGAAVSNVDDWLLLARIGLTSPWIWAGIFCLLGFVSLFAIVLSWADLSLVMPIVAIEVVVNVAFAAVFLGEEVSWTRWSGVVLVSVGVVLVAGSARRARKSECAPS